jgi:hypothetical protein
MNLMLPTQAVLGLTQSARVAGHYAAIHCITVKET